MFEPVARAPALYEHGPVPLLTWMFTGLLLKGNFHNKGCQLPKQVRGGNYRDLSSGLSNDVVAKKQMNASSYCWSPVTIEMICYSGKVGMCIVL